MEGEGPPLSDRHVPPAHPVPLDSAQPPQSNSGSRWRNLAEKKNAAEMLLARPNGCLPFWGLREKVTELSKVGLGALAFVVSRRASRNTLFLLPRCRENMGFVGRPLRLSLQPSFPRCFLSRVTSSRFQRSTHRKKLPLPFLSPWRELEGMTTCRRRKLQ